MILEVYTSICTTRGVSSIEATAGRDNEKCPPPQLFFQSFGTAHPLKSIDSPILRFHSFLDPSSWNISFMEHHHQSVDGVFTVRRCSMCKNPGAPGRDPSATTRRHVAPKVTPCHSWHPKLGDLWRRSTQTSGRIVGLLRAGTSILRSEDEDTTHFSYCHDTWLQFDMSVFFGNDDNLNSTLYRNWLWRFTNITKMYLW